MIVFCVNDHYDQKFREKKKTVWSRQVGANSRIMTTLHKTNKTNDALIGDNSCKLDSKAKTTASFISRMLK